MKKLRRFAPPPACVCRSCNRPPVVVKINTRRWRVACPYLDCEIVSAYGNSEREAIEKWNRGEVVNA